MIMRKRLILGGLFLVSFSSTFVYLAGRGEAARHDAVRVTSPVPIMHEEPATTATLLIVGDLMLDRTIRARIARDDGHEVFQGVETLLRSVDSVIGNLEGPITTEASRSVGTNVGDRNNTRFTFDPSVAHLLRREGFALVALGNNHIADVGRAGVVTTRAYLEAAGVAYVGDPFDQRNILVWQEVAGGTDCIHRI